MAPNLHRFPSQMAREIGSFLSPRTLARCTKQLCSKGVTFVEAPKPASTVAKMDLCKLIKLCRSRSSGKGELSTAKPDANAAAIVAHGVFARIQLYLTRGPKPDAKAATIVAHEVFARIQLYLTRCPNIKQLDLDVDESDEFANLVPIFRLVEQQLHTTQDVLLVAVRWHVSTSTVKAAVAYRPLHALTLSGGEQVKKAAGLTSCESLHTLDLTGCSGLTDITALRSCRSLCRLLLNETKVADLSALASCELLDHLSLRHCRTVVDVSALGACRSLRSLDLRGTYVHDVSALAKCNKLYALNLQWCTKVTDVSALSACQSLRILNLASSGVTDLSPLLACESLISVQLMATGRYATTDELLAGYSARTRAELDTINSRETWSSDLFTEFNWMI
jgi:Leucine-rich repeat (LRR) protein